MDFFDDDNALVESRSWQEACWLVISSYFDEKGIIRHQLESFNDFITHKMQDTVGDLQAINIACDAQYSDNDTEVPPSHSVSFGQLYVGRPVIREIDGQVRTLFPNEARLRDATYAASLKVAVTHSEADTRGPINEETSMIPIGSIPVMLRSELCHLSLLTSQVEVMRQKECPLDVGGYFIVNGSEKVCVCVCVCVKDERIASNSMVSPHSKSSQCWACTGK